LIDVETRWPERVEHLEFSHHILRKVVVLLGVNPPLDRYIDVLPQGRVDVFA